MDEIFKWLVFGGLVGLVWAFFSWITDGGSKNRPKNKGKEAQSRSNSKGRDAQSSPRNKGKEPVKPTSTYVKKDFGETPIKPDFFRYKAKYWTCSYRDVPGMHGSPGIGLNSSSFGSNRIEAGQKGEQELAQMVAYLGIPSKYGAQVYWSLRIPESKYDTDVDCIVAYGNTLVLLDAKNYVAGDNYEYSSKSPREGTLRVSDKTTGSVVKEYTLSRNMKMAEEAYRRAFPGMHIETAVLLCPTRNGLAGVKASTWLHDSIPVHQSWTYLNNLKIRVGAAANPYPKEWVRRRLESLLKG